jgi:RNA polymerase sigma factor (TIGR02999 family)
MTAGDPIGSGEVTRLLHQARDGDRLAVDRLVALVYSDLKNIARGQLRRERADHTLDATALVHEAYMKLAAPAGLASQDRAHFLGIAARAMRQVLVDHARRVKAEKRGGGWARTTLGGKAFTLELEPESLLALDQALDQLEERQRKVVELRYFGGLTEEEAAEVLGVSERTVRRDWIKARAWLYRILYPEGG